VGGGGSGVGRMIFNPAVSPNPSSDETTLAFKLTDNSEVSVQILNSFGNVAATLLDKKDLTKGDQKVNFSASELENGIYLIKISTNSEVQTLQLIVAH